jgi:N-glycosylase/DNA lyase
MTTFEVRTPPEEFDLPLCVQAGQVFRWKETLDGWLGVDGEDVYLASPVRGGWLVETTASEEAFVRLFRLDMDQRSLEAELIRRGPEIEPHVRALPGLRLMRPSDAVEETFCFLCTPNNNLRRIHLMVGKLGAYGDPIPAPAGYTATRFPTMERIAAIPERELRAKGFGYRAHSIPSLARQMLDLGGAGWLERLRLASYEDAREALLRLEGIGPKLADCICLFALHHTEAVPVDTHLWQATVRVYFPIWWSLPLTRARSKFVGDHYRARFGGLAGWAHQYLFYNNLLAARSRGRPRSSGP